MIYYPTTTGTDNRRSGDYSLAVTGVTDSLVPTLEVSFFGGFPNDDPAWAGHGLLTFEGESWYISGYFGHRGTLAGGSTAYVRVGFDFYDENSVSLGPVFGGYVNTVIVNPGTWSFAQATATAPAGAVRCQPFVQINPANLGAGSSVTVAMEDITIRRRVSLRMVGDLESANFSSGSAGWQILENGNAEFNNVTVRGTFESANAGNRIKIDQSVENTIYFYTGDAAEDAPGRLTVDTNGTGATRTLQVELFSPEMPNASGDYSVLVVRSASNDGSTFEPGIVFGGARNGGAYTQYGTVDYQGIWSGVDGSATAPSLRVGSTGLGGFYSSGSVPWATNGTQAIVGFTGSGNISQIYFLDTTNGIRYVESGQQFDFRISNSARLTLSQNDAIFTTPNLVAPISLGNTAGRTVRMGDGTNGDLNRFYYGTSSRKFKKDIKDLKLKEAQTLLDFRPVTFRSKEEGLDHHPVVGLIAEEVHTLFDYVITYDQDGEPEGIAYDWLVAPIIALLQDHEKRLKALE